jgi:hypothetical protein
MATDPALSLAGGCLCGKVRFEITALPVLSFACHCRGCQQLSASAFSLSLTVPTPAFRIVQGEPVIGALRKQEARYWYCDWCKTWLYTEPPAAFGFVNIRTTQLNNPADWPPFVEVWTSEKLDWVSTPAAHSYSQWPATEEFGALLTAYAARRR